MKSKIVNGVGNFHTINCDLSLIKKEMINKDNLLKLVDHREYDSYSNSELLGLMREYDFHQLTNNKALIDLIEFIIPENSTTIEIGAGTNPIGIYFKNIKAITDLKVRQAKHPINLKLLDKTVTYKKLDHENMIMNININSIDEVESLYYKLKFIKYSLYDFKLLYNLTKRILKFNSSIIEREEQFYILIDLAKKKLIKIDQVEKFDGNEIIYLYFNSKEKIKPFIESVLKENLLNQVDEIIEKNSIGNNIIGLNLSSTTIDEDAQQRVVFDMLVKELPLPIYPDFIECIDTTDAIEKYKPDVIISSWYTSNMKNEDINNEHFKRTDLLSLYNKYKFTYFLLGNKNIHSRLEILDIPHFEFYSSDILKARVSQENSINNRLYIVPGINFNKSKEDILNFAKNNNPQFNLELI